MQFQWCPKRGLTNLDRLQNMYMWDSARLGGILFKRKDKYYTT